MKFSAFRNLGLALIVLLLSGCLNYYQEVSLYPDGSGSMKIHYWMKVALRDSAEVVDQLGVFNKDSIRSEFTSKHIKLENISVVSDSSDTTLHARIDFSFAHIDSLNSTRPFADANFSLQDGAAGQKIFSQFIPPAASGFGFDGDKLTVEYVYSFPGEIITHNATIVGKKTLTWKYTMSDIGKGKTISVTYRPFKLKETPSWILWLAGAVLLIVIFYLFRKRK